MLGAMKDSVTLYDYARISVCGLHCAVVIKTHQSNMMLGLWLLLVRKITGSTFLDQRILIS